MFPDEERKEYVKVLGGPKDEEWVFIEEGAEHFTAHIPKAEKIFSWDAPEAATVVTEDYVLYKRVWFSRNTYTGYKKVPIFISEKDDPEKYLFHPFIVWSLQ